MKKILSPLTLILSLFLSFNTFAAFVYITDEVDIPVRKDKTFVDNIIRSAPSGTKLQILKTDSDGWTKIKFEKTTGWVISRYLTNNPPARIELARLKINADANKLLLKSQQAKLKDFAKELKALKIENKANKIASLKAQAEKRHIEKTYENALEIEHKNDKLIAQNLNLKSEVELLKISNTTQIENSNQTWFLYGGFILFLGTLIGFIISRRK